MPYSTLPTEADVKAAIQRELLNLAGAKEAIVFQSNLSPKTDDMDIMSIYNTMNAGISNARGNGGRASLQRVAINLRQIGDLYATTTLTAGFVVNNPDPMPDLSTPALQAAAVDTYSVAVLNDALAIVDINPAPASAQSTDPRALDVIQNQDTTEHARAMQVQKLLYLVAHDMEMVANVVT